MVWELMAVWRQYEDAKKEGRLDEAHRLLKRFNEYATELKRRNQQSEAESLDKRVEEVEKWLGLSPPQSKHPQDGTSATEQLVSTRSLP